MSSRILGAAVRASADEASARAQEAPANRPVVLSVTSTTGGLFLEWRGATVSAKRCASFTPAVGDRVLCLLVDSQLVVIDQIV